MNNYPENQISLSAYDLFVLGITAQSLIAVVVILAPFFNGPAKDISRAFDYFFCLIFFIDFLYLLFNSPSKKVYLRRDWIDLLGCLPVISVFRFFRIYRATRIIRFLRQNKLSGVESSLKKYPERITFFSIFLVAIILVSISSYAVLSIELNSPQGNIRSASDALWWSIVTVTTVGYGDRVPTTVGGRIIAGLLMFIGIGIFSALTSYLSTVFIKRRDKYSQNEVGGDEIKARLMVIEQQIQELTALIKNQKNQKD